MEKIKLKFSATPSLFPANGVVVVLTLDEKGKIYVSSTEIPGKLVQKTVGLYFKAGLTTE